MNAPTYWAVYRLPGETRERSNAWYSQDRRDGFLSRFGATVIAVGAR